MSKRKSRSKSLFVAKDDMVFLDDSDSEIGMKISNSQLDKKSEESDSKKAMEVDASGVRISARAKKQKNIYDPSLNNGPVHKKKKEAMEAAALLEESKKKSPKKTPLKVVKAAKSAIVLQKTPQDVRKKLNMNMDKPVEEKPTVAPTGVLRIERPVVAVAIKEPAAKRVVVRKNQLQLTVIEHDSGTSSSANSEFEKASTVELDDNKNVAKWSADEVYNYFISQGFDQKDSVKFKDQEIDGEALMILNREDLKELGIQKVGTFVKMWNRIIALQSGRKDFSQGWK